MWKGKKVIDITGMKFGRLIAIKPTNIRRDCGIEPKQIRKDRLHLNGDYVHNGIDRLDSSRGYILENCVPCCKVCNYAKRNMSVNDFLNWIKKVYNYNLEREL